MARRRLRNPYFYVEYPEYDASYYDGDTITLPEYEATGGTEQLLIIWVRRCNFEILGLPDWITYRIYGGGATEDYYLYLEAEENDTTEVREGSFTIESNYNGSNHVVTIEVSQGVQSIEHSLYFAYEGDEETPISETIVLPESGTSDISLIHKMTVNGGNPVYENVTNTAALYFNPSAYMGYEINTDSVTISNENNTDENIDGSVDGRYYIDGVEHYTYVEVRLERPAHSYTYELYVGDGDISDVFWQIFPYDNPMGYTNVRTSSVYLITYDYGIEVGRTDITSQCSITDDNVDSDITVETNNNIIKVINGRENRVITERFNIYIEYNDLSATIMVDCYGTQYEFNTNNLQEQIFPNSVSQQQSTGSVSFRLDGRVNTGFPYDTGTAPVYNYANVSSIYQCSVTSNDGNFTQLETHYDDTSYTWIVDFVNTGGAAQITFTVNDTGDSVTFAVNGA